MMEDLPKIGTDEYRVLYEMLPTVQDLTPEQRADRTILVADAGMIFRLWQIAHRYDISFETPSSTDRHGVTRQEIQNLFSSANSESIDESQEADGSKSSALDTSASECLDNETQKVASSPPEHEEPTSENISPAAQLDAISGDRQSSILYQGGGFSRGLRRTRREAAILPGNLQHVSKTTSSYGSDGILAAQTTLSVSSFSQSRSFTTPTNFLTSDSSSVATSTSTTQTQRGSASSLEPPYQPPPIPPINRPESRASSWRDFRPRLATIPDVPVPESPIKANCLQQTDFPVRSSSLVKVELGSLEIPEIRADIVRVDFPPTGGEEALTGAEDLTEDLEDSGWEALPPLPSSAPPKLPPLDFGQEAFSLSSDRIFDTALENISPAPKDTAPQVPGFSASGLSMECRHHSAPSEPDALSQQSSGAGITPKQRNHLRKLLTNWELPLDLADEQPTEDGVPEIFRPTSAAFRPATNSFSPESNPTATATTTASPQYGEDQGKAKGKAIDEDVSSLGDEGSYGTCATPSSLTITPEKLGQSASTLERRGTARPLPEPPTGRNSLGIDDAPVRKPFDMNSPDPFGDEQ